MAPMSSAPLDVLVVGGGAAGFFAAIACAEADPTASITLLERSARPLNKVRISGGGRCNVTHDMMDPGLLVRNYPRGGRALRGPLHRFGPRETITWFAARGVELKTESDGRMFPTTDDSETIVSTLVNAAEHAGVRLRLRAAVTDVRRNETAHGVSSGGFSITVTGEDTLRADRVLLATGSNPRAYDWAASLGHTIVPPVPSLFTFEIDDPRLGGLAGISVPDAHVRLEGTKLEQRGPLLITHWGLSGPAVLKLSAWGARELYDRAYDAALRVDWLAGLPPEQVAASLAAHKDADARKLVTSSHPFDLPQRLWESLVKGADVADGKRWADLSKLDLRSLTDELCRGRYRITGKGVFKEEFVTCGGIHLDEVDFRTMESKVCRGLHVAGEILDIDGVTGGFNFQSAWTTGWLAGRAMATPAA